MAEHFITSVVLDGKNLQSVSNISLNQEIFNHHRFDVRLPFSSLVSFEKKEDPFPALKACIGRAIEITIRTATDVDRDGQQDQSIFKGIVTDVNVIGHRWEHAIVNISGSSPTVLMDGIPNSQAYSQKSIKQIFETCVAKHLSSEIAMTDNLTYTDKLMYTVQYNESDFEFIKRLCYQYGEWCYYDGKSLCLGLKPAKKIIHLTKDRILNLDYNYSLAPARPSSSFRNYQKHEVEKLSPKKSSFNDEMAGHSLKESYNAFNGYKSSNIFVPSSFSGDGLQNEKGQIQHQIDVSQDSHMANLLTVSCQSDVAGITVGSIIKLDKLPHSGDFIVTSITHSSFGAKSYSNHFVAIPKDALFPSGLNIKLPQVRECSAIIKDNKDPEKLGRVKVQFDWGLDTPSPWIRMVMPHAGDNRGFYFVPEIGDEVLVGFEMGNPDYPYVIGSLYNGKNNFGGRANDNNNLKSISTRSGNEILFDDDGSIVISNEHNSFTLACADDGSITLQTDGDMIFTAGKKMEFNSGKDMIVNPGENYKITTQKDFNLKAKGAGTIETSGNLEVKSKGDMSVKTNKELSLSGAKAVVNGTSAAELSGGLTTIKGTSVKIN